MASTCKQFVIFALIVIIAGYLNLDKLKFKRKNKHYDYPSWEVPGKGLEVKETSDKVIVQLSNTKDISSITVTKEGDLIVSNTFT